MSDAPRSRTRAFLLTLATGQALGLLTMLVGFVATPFLLRYLGLERFGVWRVLEVWVAYLGLVPQCVALAVGFLLVPLLAARDPDRLRRFAATAAVIGGAVAALAALAGLALVPLLPWIVAAPDDLAGERRVAFLIAILAAVPLAPLLLLRSALEADQRGYLLNLVVAAQSLTVTGVGVWLAASGAGLPGQAVAVASGAALQGLLFALLACRLYPWALPGRPGRADAAALLRRTSGLIVLAVMGGVAARIEYPLVNALGGPEETARYSLGQRLFLVYGGLVAAVGNSIWAPVADLFHRGEAGRLRDQLGRSVRAVTAGGAAGAVAVAAVTVQFLRLWVGDGFDPGPVARAGFAVTYPLLGLNILLTWVLSATGRNRAMLVGTATYFVVTAAAGVGLGRSLGAGGVAWGTASGAAAAVAVNLFACRGAFGLAAGPLAARLLATAALATAYALGLSELVAAVPDLGWAGLLAALAGGWAGFLPLAAFAALTREDRAEIRARLLWKKA